MAGTTLPLTKKLGVRPGQTVVLLGAPERFAARFEGEVAALLPDVKVSRQLRPAPDCVVLFIDSLGDLEDRLCPINERLHPDTQIWVAWRTRRAADVREDVVRRIFMTAGMVDTKLAPLDKVWTGMRLVTRPENKDALAYRLEISPRRTRRATRPPQYGSGAGSALATARARKRS